MRKIFNIMIRFLIIWAIVGFTIRFVLRDKPSKRISDVQMAEVFVKDHQELKATWKQLDDGWIIKTHFIYCVFILLDFFYI